MVRPQNVMLIEKPDEEGEKYSADFDVNNFLIIKECIDDTSTFNIISKKIYSLHFALSPFISFDFF